jgi:hypothetical protein
MFAKSKFAFYRYQQKSPAEIRGAFFVQKLQLRLFAALQPVNRKVIWLAIRPGKTISNK